MTADSHTFVKVLGEDSGLSDNYVVSIASDKRGVLWVATEDGLNIFDGNKFTPIYKNDKSPGDGIGGNELNVLYDDPQDSIMWIGTQRSGLDAYDYREGKFYHYRHNDKDARSLVTDDVTGIASTPEGDILVATYWRGVDFLDREKNEFIHYNSDNVRGMPANNVWTVADAGNSDEMFVGHTNGGMTIVSRKNRTARNFKNIPSDISSIPSNTVRAILPYRGKEILVGTEAGLCLFNTESRNFRRFSREELAGKAVYDIIKLRNGAIAVATEFDGVFMIDMSGGFSKAEESCRRLIGAQELSKSKSLSIRALLEDEFGNLWVGTYGRGVDFIPAGDDLVSLVGKSPVVSESADQSVAEIIVRCIVSDDEGRIWAGTDGDGISVFDQNTLTATYTSLGGDKASEHFNAAYRDKFGNLWFGAYDGGVIYRDSKSGRFSRIGIDNSLDVRSFYESGDTVFALATQGIHMFDSSSRRHLGSHDIVGVRDMAVDGGGKIWIATFGDGLGVYSADWRELKYFKVRDKFPSNAINDIFPDSKGRIWVATHEGLVCFPDANSYSYTVLNSESGLPNSHASSVIEDNDGVIWVTTKKGVSAIEENRVSSFTSHHGIPMSSFADRGAIVGSDGRLYFAADKGIYTFNPRELLKERSAPEVVISSFRAYGPDGKMRNMGIMGQVAVGRRYTLPYNFNSISFTAGILNFADADKVEYSFMLKGFDKDWYQNGSNSVTYRNVPPGIYTLKVRSRIRNQKWSDEITEISFRILPPMWLTWWAKLIYIIVALALLFFMLSIYRKRVKAESMYLIERKHRIQSQELTDERLRFYTNITHELRTPLTLIVSPLEDTLRDPGLSDANRNRLSMIYRNADNLLKLVNQILDFRKTETNNKRLCIRTENIIPVVYDTALKYKELISDPNVRIEIRTTEEEVVIPFDREVIKMILDNLITNAIKYTAKGVIDISCGVDVSDGDKMVVISVSDTGYGIGEEALPNIFNRYYQEKSSHQASGTGIGLSLVKNLVDLHHGRISVQSRINSGSRFTVYIPEENDYPEALHPDDENSSISITESAEGEELVETRALPLLLLVEDNKDLRDYITDTFIDLYEVKTAEDGRKGLEMAHKLMPDLIITDIMMPVMDGIEMCRAIKNDVATSHIPVIILTAKTSEADREIGYSVGANSYLIKPFSSQLLISRVNNLLREHERIAKSNLPLMTKGTDKTSTSLEPEEKSARPENVIDRKFLEKLNNTILNHMSTEQVDIPFLADALCVSKATLYRKVKALTGVSPNEFIRKVRLQVAERLIIEGKLSIQEISFKVGFNSTPYFRQCFKDEFGVTPTEYISRMK